MEKTNAFTHYKLLFECTANSNNNNGRPCIRVLKENIQCVVGIIFIVDAFDFEKILVYAKSVHLKSLDFVIFFLSLMICYLEFINCFS